MQQKPFSPESLKRTVNELNSLITDINVKREYDGTTITTDVMICMNVTEEQTPYSIAKMFSQRTFFPHREYKNRFNSVYFQMSHCDIDKSCIKLEIFYK